MEELRIPNAFRFEPGNQSSSNLVFFFFPFLLSPSFYFPFTSLATHFSPSFEHWECVLRRSQLEDEEALAGPPGEDCCCGLLE